MNNIKYIGLLTFTLIAGIFVSQAATRLTVASGNWSSSSVWQNGVLPTSGDDVVIKGHAITVNTAAAVQTLTIETGGSMIVNAAMSTANFTGNTNTTITVNAALTAKRLTINSGTTFTMNADVTVAEVIQNSQSTLNVNCNTLTINNTISGSASNVVFMYDARAVFNNPCCGTVKFTNRGKVTANSNVLHFGKVVFENGSIDIGQNANEYNNIQFDCGVEFTNAGTVSLPYCRTYDNITVTNTTLDLGTCAVINGYLKLNTGGDVVTNTITYGTNARLIFNRSYTLTGSSVIWPSGSGTNVPPTIELQSGTLTLNDSMSVKRRLNLLGGTIGTSSTKLKLLANDTVFICGGGFATSPKYYSNVTTQYCNTIPGNPPATIGGTNMPSGGYTGDLIISTNVKLSSNVQVAGRVVVNSTGILTDSSFAISTATSVKIDSGAVVKVSKSGGLVGTNSLLGSLPTTLACGSTVIYNAPSGTQQVDARMDYGSVTLDGNSQKSFEATQYGICGDFTVTNGSGAVSMPVQSNVKLVGVNQSVSGANFYDVTCQGTGTKTIASTSTVTGTLNVDAGSKLNTNNMLTLKSTKNATAVIGPLLNGADIVGNICWERFIPGGSSRRRWRFLSMPITGLTFHDAWQDDIFITGPGTGGTPCNFNTTSTASMVPNVNGFDQNHTYVPTIYTWDETTATWSTIPTTNNTIINPLKAYRTYVRGDRNVEGCLLMTLMPDSVSDVLIDACGPLVKGTQSFPLTYTANKGGGWNYVSNPYPAPIDWSNATWKSARGNTIDPTLYVYDPAIGQYTSWHPVAGSVNGGSPIIGKDQSFFIRATQNVSLVFQESYKVDTLKAGFFGKSENKAANRLSIVFTGPLDAKDEAVFYMNENAAASYDPQYDGYKSGYTTGSIAVSKKTSPADKFAFEAIPFVTNADTVTLYTYLTNADGSFKLTFGGMDNIDAQLGYLLKDNYDNSLTNIRGVSEYAFESYANDPASYNQNRFQLIIVNNGALPVTLSTFNGKKVNKTAELTWITNSEINNSHFIVERSGNGSDFEAIGTVKGHGTTNSTNSYSFIDASLLKGTNYYRLRQVDFNGDENVSYTVAINNAEVSHVIENISIFPVPAKDVINVSLGNAAVNGKVSVRVIDLLGKVVLSKEADAAQNVSFDLSGLQPGAYIMSVDVNGESKQIKFNKL